MHFDPIGVLLQPGQRAAGSARRTFTPPLPIIRRTQITPSGIPADARPWDSKYLLPGRSFEVELTVEGIYGYFCTPHEAAGMVGRLIVDKPSGPGALPFDYFVDDPNQRGWRRVPKSAQAAFPKIGEILAAGSVHPP